MSRSTVDTRPRPGSGREPDTEPQPGDDGAFFGRPKGLLTLSGVEVWERFSFLGMQAILVLCFADTLTHGGKGTAASVSAAYGTLVYPVSVAGGRLGDHKGRHRGFSAAAIGMTFGLIQYVAGRRHRAGRKHSAEFALTSGMSATAKLAPAAFAGRTMSLWFLSLALANGIQAQTVKLYDGVSRPACFGVNGAIPVAAGLAEMALAPWLRRTMHPVH